ncbi:MAG: chromate transporter [Anaerolineales bacterium]|nr:MAG: chromate transporter [Anaerolineales bacterium]
MLRWLTLFWLFIKINLLSTSGPASVGLLYKEVVGKLMTESEFVEAVGFSSVLPGSDALQLAMFVGYTAGGVPGSLAALLGSILPPTVLMLTIVSVLQRLRGEAWVGNFVRGLGPAVAVLMIVVAWQVFQGEEKDLNTITLGIAAASLLAYLLKVPPPLVLAAAGVVGIVFFR